MAGMRHGSGFATSIHGLKRWLALLLVLVVAAGLTGPGVHGGRSAAYQGPGSGPDQRWGTADGLPHEETNGRGNVDKARSLQSKYPAIAGQDDPKPADNQVRVLDAQVQTSRGFDAASSRELPEARGRTQRTFANADGTRTTEFSRDPLNYQRPDGSWQPVDTGLVPQARDGGWRNAADSVGMWLAPTAGAGALATLDLGPKHRIEFGLANANPSTGRAEGSAVTYAGVRPQADVRLEITSIGLKEAIVLHSADAPHTWLFPLTLTGLSASLVDGAVLLRDDQGNVRARIPQGYMVDSAYDDRMGEAATSFGVTYKLVQHKGQLALQVDLDSAWLRDPKRSYPVTVDPPVDLRDASSSMYVQRNSNGSNFSRVDGDLKVGHSFDSAGNYTAASYIGFDGVESALRNHKIHGVQLGITNYHSWSCNARPVTVHAVTEPWQANNSHRFPGPAHGPELSSASFAHGYIPRGTTRSPCPTATEPINLGAAGRDLVQRWVNGEQPNFGLSVRASETDVFGWKKFTGAGTANPPRLSVTHSPYDATYRFDNPVPNPPVTRTQGGRVKITATNTGATTWTPAHYALAYRYFTTTGTYLGWAESALPQQDVPRGASVTFDALIAPTPPGDYRFEFSMVHRGVAFFTDHQVPPAVLAFRVIDVPPVIREQYPPNGYSAPTLTPSLWARGLDVDAPPNSNLQYRFEVCEPGPINCFDSSRQPNATWTVPLGRLQWSKTYQWRVFAFDGTSESPALPFSTLLTAVPQPEITAHLGNAPYGGRSGEFDPQVGNYTTSAIDATVSTVGPQLSVVRTYNSLDPRRDTAFGAGWSSHYDMRIVPDGDGSGNVVVTYPDGQQARFGANLLANGQPNGGRLAAPPGRYATLVPATGGGWTLTDKSASLYVFGADGKLKQLYDNAGRLVELTYGTDGKLTRATNKTSNRSLRFTWTGRHVTKIDTDPVDGQALSWIYGYNGDRLTSVCDPTGGCTRYDHTPGSHYRSAIVDSKPDSYWRLGERSGTDAVSQIALNLGADKGRYHEVTLGTQGVLAGTDDPAATFNGTSSAVILPDGLVKKSRELTVEMWFKTTSGGPLFGAQTKPHGQAPTGAVPILYIGNDGKLRGEFWFNQFDPITTANPVNDGNWHHVVLTSSLTTQTLYLDGQAAGSRSGVIDNSFLTYTQIGAAYTVPPSSWPQWGTESRRSFNGVIDEVAVYQHPLGQPAIQAHYNARAQADYQSRTLLPSGKTAAQLRYDGTLDRLTEYTDRNGGTWKLGAPVTSGDPTNIIRTVRVTDPGNRAHFYDYDPVRGRIVRYLAPLGMETRPEDQPPPTTTPPPPPPECPPPPGFCEIPIGGGPGSFPPVDFQGARTFDYDDAGFQSTIIDENGNSITLTHDQRGNVLSRKTCRTGPTDCQTAHFEYFPVGSNLTDPLLDKVVGARDARSSGPTDNRFRTAFVYTTLGLLETQTTPDGAVVRHTYTTNSDPAFGGGNTPAGLVATSTDPRGAITRYAYFSTGDLAEIRTATGLITRFTYDTLGRRITTTQISDSFPQSVTTTSTYDKLGHITSITGPATKNAITDVTHTGRAMTSYDADGNPTRIEQVDLSGGDPTRVTTLHYDAHNRVERITDAEGGETSFGYDVFGNRTRMVNAAGVQYEYAYTARNKIAEVRLRGWHGDPGSAEPGPADRLVVASYAYDLAGQLVRRTDAMGRTTRYRYYSDGLLRQTIAAGIRNPDNTTRDLLLAEYAYDAAGSMSRVTQAGGLVTSYETDAVGRRTTTTFDPNGLARRTALRYDLNGNVTQVSMTGKESNTGAFDDTVAEVVDYGYDAFGRRTSETVHTGTEDLKSTWGYDQRGLITSVTDPRGTATGANPAHYTTNISYDQHGRPVTVTSPPVMVETVGAQPASRRPTISTGYNTFGDNTERKDANGQIWRSGYDKLGRPTSTTSPDYTPPGATQPIRATSRMEYDPLGQIRTVTGPRGAVTRYAYDQLGRLVERTDPDQNNPAEPGGVWRYTYTRVGEQLSVTDPTGARTEATYDDLGRQITSSVLERQSTPGTFTSRFGYDDASNLRTAVSPTDATSRYDYDLLGQLIKTTSPAGVVTQLGYDRSGRLVKTTDAAGRAHRSTVDLAGRTTKEIDISPQGGLIRQTQLGYDRAGNLATVTDPLNHVTRFTVDALDRLTQQVEPVSATESITTSFGYDAAGNRTRYTDGRGNATGYTVNSWDLPESVIEAATAAHPNLPERTWTASYDASANPVTLTAPGGVRQNRTFNGVDRLTRVTGSGAESTTVDKTYTYDILGRLATSSAPGGDNTFTYNDRGALLSTSGPSGDSSLGYDPDGNLTTRTDAAGTSRNGYSNGRLATLQDGITGVAQTLGYNTSGQLSTIDFGAGRIRTFTYDNLARLETDTLAAGTNQIARTTYGYDLSDWLTSKTTQGVAGAGSNTYGYDFAGRLTSWTKDGTTTNYSWDAATNRTRAGDKTATYDQRNRLTNDGTSSYTYTPRGTRATKTTGAAATENFSFDAFDRLITHGPVNYTYDALDRVATRNAQRFTYTGATNELATDGTTRFARGPFDELLALGAGPEQRLTLADQRGDIIGGFTPTGPLTGLAESISYDPFGVPTASGGTRRPIGYQGDYTDPDTGQVNMTARWYDPSTGAFTSRDTVGPANRYTYTGGSPLNRIDPTGHYWVWVERCWKAPGPFPSQICFAAPQWEDPGGAAGSGSGVTCGDRIPGNLDFANPCDTGPALGGTGELGHGSGAIQGTGSGSGSGKGSGSGAGKGGGKPGARPNPSKAARNANREAARNNPMPIPPALQAPLYGDSTSPPVSSAPDVPSNEADDYRDPVDDVNRSYEKLQKSLTVPNETLLGNVKDTIAAPSETTQASLPFMDRPLPDGPSGPGPGTEPAPPEAFTCRPDAEDCIGNHGNPGAYASHMQDKFSYCSPNHGAVFYCTPNPWDIAGNEQWHQWVADWFEWSVNNAPGTLLDAYLLEMQERASRELGMTLIPIPGAGGPGRAAQAWRLERAQQKLKKAMEAARATIPAGETLGTWGNKVWGGGRYAAASARALIGTRSAAELRALGLTVESAQMWRNAYQWAAEAGRGGRAATGVESAQARVELLDNIIATLKGG